MSGVPSPQDSPLLPLAQAIMDDLGAPIRLVVAAFWLTAHGYEKPLREYVEKAVA